VGLGRGNQRSPLQVLSQSSPPGLGGAILTIRGDDKANYVALIDRLRRGKRIVIHGGTESKAK
jgi:hypothetical protein